jgi:LEA14-like dessication related protein
MNRIVMANVQIVLLVFCAAGCTSLPESLVGTPRVELKNVHVVGLGFKSQTFLLSFDVSNPNPFPLPVRDFGYSVNLNGKRFASGETQNQFTIPSNGDSSFAISVELDLLQTSPQLLSIVRGGSRQNIAYELEGRFGIDFPPAASIKFRNDGMVRLNIN